MRIERLSDNKVMLSVSYEELREKGCLKKHILEDSYIWHEIFDEMLDVIEEQLDIDTEGMIAIEVHSMSGDELVLILTIDHFDFLDKVDEVPAESEDTLGCDLTFKFQDIEDAIGLVHDEKKVREIQSALYYFKDAYYICFSFDFDSQYDGLEAALLEYASPSSLPEEMLKEYATPVIQKEATKKIYEFFVKKA
ncbi:hypothetical protein F9802_01715 [Bacillus aerolatus]|uniref:Genetic competence negative regulator n=1 Tax=Bacillus aerolatus TaxID=2653354 RepID=A0A6I1FJM1_9BACI|nr:adaptor protein MecA [Bacillus aerolatus]KAB7708888.1 hypothetical protein F9802_01715 [Bacillus aerolatus]